MLKELNIDMTIDVEEKMLYIGEENSSGAKYPYNNIEELFDKIKFYLENYCSKEIEEGEKFFKMADNVELMYECLRKQVNDTEWIDLKEVKVLQDKGLINKEDKPKDLREKLDCLVEKIWEGLEDIPFYEEDSEQYIEEDYLKFEEGTSKEEIWHWFDERHSKGVAYLLNEYEIGGESTNYLDEELEEEL